MPIIAIALLFWLLLIRPQAKRQKELSRMQSSLRPGDEVMMGSGIFATVTAIDDDRARVHVEVAPGVQLQVARGAIAQVVEQADRLDEVDGTTAPDDASDLVDPTDPTSRRDEQGPRGDH
nr:preprotein translocase subunit YajC [Nocardioides perillae]